MVKYKWHNYAFRRTPIIVKDDNLYAYLRMMEWFNTNNSSGVVSWEALADVGRAGK